MTNRLSLSALTRLKTFRDDESGQDLMEYGLLVSLIATFLIGTLNVVGDQVETMWRVIAEGIRY